MAKTKVADETSPQQTQFLPKPRNHDPKSVQKKEKGGKGRGCLEKVSQRPPVSPRHHGKTLDSEVALRDQTSAEELSYVCHAASLLETADSGHQDPSCGQDASTATKVRFRPKAEEIKGLDVCFRAA